MFGSELLQASGLARPSVKLQPPLATLAARAGVNPDQEILSLRIRAPLGASPEITLENIMGAAARRAGAAWSRQGEQDMLKEKAWQLQHDLRGILMDLSSSGSNLRMRPNASGNSYRMWWCVLAAPLPCWRCKLWAAWL